ncbi:hypothetical protein HDE_13991 [Halotydeus destructor]|nr:hypothetical protein HDE_13991 [Halotydeus destructor]
MDIPMVTRLADTVTSAAAILRVIQVDMDIQVDPMDKAIQADIPMAMVKPVVTHIVKVMATLQMATAPATVTLQMVTAPVTVTLQVVMALGTVTLDILRAMVTPTIMVHPVTVMVPTTVPIMVLTTVPAMVLMALQAQDMAHQDRMMTMTKQSHPLLLPFPHQYSPRKYKEATIVAIILNTGATL